MKNFFIALFFAGVLLVGCDEIDCAIEPAECEFLGISPVATPTPEPDIDAVQQDINNWLDDYLSKDKLW